MPMTMPRKKYNMIASGMTMGKCGRAGWRVSSASRILDDALPQLQVDCYIRATVLRAS